MTMESIIAQLYKVFDQLNEKLFEGCLPKCMLTVQAEGRKHGILGWTTVYKVWTGTQEGDQWEINLVAEYLNRPYLEVISTLLHEMVHLENLSKGVKDVSGFGYHNSNFKEAAEKRGMWCGKHSKPSCGLAHTWLKDETVDLIMGLDFDKSVFTIRRYHIGEIGTRAPGADDGDQGGKEPGTVKPPKQKTKMLKWSCGCTNVRCAVKLEATCEKCGQKFELQD